MADSRASPAIPSHAQRAVRATATAPSAATTRARPGPRPRRARPVAVHRARSPVGEPCRVTVVGARGPSLMTAGSRCVGAKSCRCVTRRPHDCETARARRARPRARTAAAPKPDMPPRGAGRIQPPPWMPPMRAPSGAGRRVDERPACRRARGGAAPPSRPWPSTSSASARAGSVLRPAGERWR